MRKYKIIEEKIPSEDFTRWIPMVTNTITKTGIMVSDQNLWKWEKLPEWEKLSDNSNFWSVGKFGNKSYCETFLEAQELIDRHENYKKHEEGDFIVNEFEYKPKPI